MTHKRALASNSKQDQASGERNWNVNLTALSIPSVPLSSSVRICVICHLWSYDVVCHSYLKCRVPLHQIYRVVDDVRLVCKFICILTCF
jgi:hypothetical protein